MTIYFLQLSSSWEILQFMLHYLETRYFEKQFELAYLMKLPMFLHMRAAAKDFCDILERNKDRWNFQTLSSIDCLLPSDMKSSVQWKSLIEWCLSFEWESLFPSVLSSLWNFSLHWGLWPQLGDELTACTDFFLHIPKGY